MAAIFTLEDGTGVAGANAYLSVADADQYHENRGTPDPSWLNLTQPVKEQAIRSATAYLDNHYGARWKGYRAAKANALDWPRSRVVDGDGFSVDGASIPAQVESACAESALRSLDTAQNPTGLTPDVVGDGLVTYKREKGEGIGEEETHYANGINPYVKFTAVDQLLRDVLKSRAGGVIRS